MIDTTRARREVEMARRNAEFDRNAEFGRLEYEWNRNGVEKHRVHTKRIHLSNAIQEHKRMRAKAERAWVVPAAEVPSDPAP